MQRQKSRYKIAGIDYEKHGDGVCFGDYFGSGDWEIVSGREAEEDRRMGLWTTVRLQHSRDEFPFVVSLFLLLLFNPFSYYYFGHVGDDTKMVGMGVPWLELQYFLLFLTRRDDILVLKDIHYITGWVFRLPLGHRIPLVFKFVFVA